MLQLTSYKNRNHNVFESNPKDIKHIDNKSTVRNIKKMLKPERILISSNKYELFVCAFFLCLLRFRGLTTKNSDPQE